MDPNEQIKTIVEKMSDTEYNLRQMLFLHHGCPISALYGDDGERQCNACKIDFIRMTPEEIQSRFYDIGMSKLLSIPDAIKAG